MQTKIFGAIVYGQICLGQMSLNRTKHQKDQRRNEVICGHGGDAVTALFWAVKNLSHFVISPFEGLASVSLSRQLNIGHFTFT